MKAISAERTDDWLVHNKRYIIKQITMEQIAAKLE